MSEQERYIFHSGPIPDNYTIDFQLPVYYQHDYLALHDIGDSQCHYLLDTQNNIIVGKIVIVRSSQGDPVSMPYAPFGSFCYRPGTPVSPLQKWVSHLMLHRMVIRHYAPIYQPDNTSVFAATGHLPKTEITTDINHHLLLNDRIEKRIHPMQLRRISKCENAGYNFAKSCYTTEVEKVYDFLAACRQEQGLQININKEKFMQSFERLPDHYKAFIVTSNTGEIAAASVTLKVTDRIVYNYLPGSLKKYNNFSPMAFLLYRLMTYMSDQGFSIMDLGISSMNGNEQAGLALFKERMGAIRTDKLTYRFL